jgi:hypothetical protein
MTRAAPTRSDPDARRPGLARIALSPNEAAIALGVPRSFFFAEILLLLADAQKRAAHGDR